MVTLSVGQIFVPDRSGVLMKMDEDEETRFIFETWFEYTRKAMMEIREGRLLAVKNYASEQTQAHYSILETVSTLPVHYALGTNPEGYPGFVMEAARNVSTDWLSQETDSQEDTTIIRCSAAPTGWELVEDDKGRILGSESSIPMIGADVRVLTSEATKEIINMGMSGATTPVFEAGKWLVDGNIPVEIYADEFVRVHFGIFGFTGVGKSNLVSTYVSKLLATFTAKKEPIKIVLFDLMSEYSALLIDKLVDMPDAYILAVDEQALPGSLVDYLKGNASKKDDSIKDLVATTLCPRALEGMRQSLSLPFATLVSGGKMKVLNRFSSMRGFLQQNCGKLIQNNPGNIATDLNLFIRNLHHSVSNVVPTPSLVQDILDACDRIEFSQPAGAADAKMVQDLLSGLTFANRVTATAMNNLNEFRDNLRELQGQIQTPFDPATIFSLDQIMQHLNDRSCSTLVVVQSHNPDSLREFANDLGQELYEMRRRSGRTNPLVSVIFDEADEFIPNTYDAGTSYERSARIAETLARRGRKFGIGVGICTQRTRYLKTSVMAQPHTYLVSRMPRITDRQVILEAFGISEEMFRQTFKFAPGDWLLTSFDATGIKGVPIPIHADDANKRVAEYLRQTRR